MVQSENTITILYNKIPPFTKNIAIKYIQNFHIYFKNKIDNQIMRKIKQTQTIPIVIDQGIYSSIAYQQSWINPLISLNFLIWTDTKYKSWAEPIMNRITTNLSDDYFSIIPESYYQN